MNKRYFLSLAFMVAMCLGIQAQSQFHDLLPQTAKVMFIDSVVVDKEGFMRHIPLCREAGLLATYEDYFGKTSEVPCGVYRNEFGNRCYFAKGDSLHGTSLYSMDLVGGEWSEAKRIDELNGNCPDANYPFLMSDGFTLFFAAKGDHSLGGYDIFMTLFDSENGTFYKPENYGLPFNSTANDYLIAFDELDSLGWLVSDRYQPEGKVCIYTFVPTFPRMGFNGKVDKDKLHSFAKLNSIKDTWDFGDRERAMTRLQAMLTRRGEMGNGMMSLSKGFGTEEMAFIINDKTVYYHATDFLSPTAKKLYGQYTELSTMVMLNERKLDSQREAYSNGNAKRRAELRQPILRLEHDIELQRNDLKNLEKKIRNAENSIIKL